MNHSLVCMRLRSYRSVSVPMLCTLCTGCEEQNWRMEQKKKVAWSKESYFLFHHDIIYLGKSRHQDALWEKGSVMIRVFAKARGVLQKERALSYT